jgi:hypothetical protein
MAGGMSEMRSLAIGAHEIATIESVGQDLLRQGDAQRGLTLLALCLAWRSVGRPLPLPAPSEPSERLADVVDLHAYSRRAGS